MPRMYLQSVSRRSLTKTERRRESLHWRVFIEAAVNALCSALSEISSAIHAIVNGTALPPMEDTIYSGARCENGPNTGVTTSNTKITMAAKFPKMIVGQRRPRSGPSEIQTARREYTAVNALPRVGYSFYFTRGFNQKSMIIQEEDIKHTIWATV